MPISVSKAGTPLGPIGTKIVFENEHVRVWAIELPPKGHQPLHEHYLPYVIVAITEGKSMMRWEDGRTRDLTDYAGEVKYRETGGGPHELFNLEDKPFHSVLVELKNAAPPS